MRNRISLVLICFLSLVFIQSPAQQNNLKNKKETGPAVFTQPEYYRGKKKMDRIVHRKLKYPRQAKKNRIEGNVYISMVIDTLGNPVKIQVERGIGYGCNEEALRVVKKLKKWKPATRNGKAIMTKTVVEVRFTLKKKKSAKKTENKPGS